MTLVFQESRKKSTVELPEFSDVYAAQNPEVLMVSEGKTFFSSQPLLKCRVMCL